MQIEVKTRTFDKETVVWGYDYDPNFTEEINEKNEAYISKRWVILGVFDNEEKARTEARQWYSVDSLHPLYTGVPSTSNNVRK